MAGHRVDCHKQGRRVHQAHAMALHKIGALKDEAERWRPAKFGGCDKTLQQAQGSIRMCFGLAKRKLAFLNSLPYCLSQLGQAGAKEHCLEEFRKFPEQQHHAVTLKILGESSHVRALILALPDKIECRLPDELEQCPGI